MLRSITTFFVCSLIATSAFSLEQKASPVLDAQGKLILEKPTDIGLQMTAQCKSFRISKNPPLIPKLKCRFS